MPELEGGRDKTSGLVCINLASGFGKRAKTFEGAGGVSRRCDVVVTVEGVVTVRCNDGDLAGGALVHASLVKVAFGHGDGCGREFPEGLCGEAREIGEIAIV